jgi:hypothetical protein
LEVAERDSSLFSPTLREPSLIKEELEAKGSGAASFDSFYGKVIVGTLAGRDKDKPFHTSCRPWRMK